MSKNLLLLFLLPVIFSVVLASSMDPALGQLRILFDSIPGNQVEVLIDQGTATQEWRLGSSADVTVTFRAIIGDGSQFITFNDESIQIAAGETGSTTFTVNIPDGTPLGMYEVELEAIGATPTGDVSSVHIITINVVDAPDVTPPEFLDLIPGSSPRELDYQVNLYVNDPAGTTPTNVNYPLPEINESGTVTCSPGPGSPFQGSLGDPIASGNYTITCSAQDTSQNTAPDATFLLRVIHDAEVPTLTGLDDVNTFADMAEESDAPFAIVSYSPVAGDNIALDQSLVQIGADGTIATTTTTFVTCDPPAGSQFDVDPTETPPSRDHTVTCTALDLAGNPSAANTFTVTIRAPIEPSTSDPSNQAASADIGTTFAQVNNANPELPPVSGDGFITGGGGGGGGGGAAGRLAHQDGFTPGTPILYKVSWDCNVEKTTVITTQGNIDVTVRSQDLVRAVPAEAQDLPGRIIHEADHYSPTMSVNIRLVDGNSVRNVNESIQAAECVGERIFAQYSGTTSPATTSPDPEPSVDPMPDPVDPPTREPVMDDPPEDPTMDPMPGEPADPEPVPPAGGTDDGGCLIATAAFGSELAPQVQMLREIRDGQLLQTESGSAFMGAFNNVYYAFSPAVADLERENPVFKETVRALVTPMLSTLHIMSLADDESSVLSLGLAVIALNLGMYVAAPAYVGYRVCKSRL